MKRNKLLLSVGALLLVLVFVLTACGAPVAQTTETTATQAKANDTQKAEDTTKAEPVKKVLIGYDAFSDTVSFSKKITDNLLADAKKEGITVVKADSSGDPTAAMKNVDSFIAQGATVIVECSWVVAAVEAVAKKCKAANIPCISIDIPVADAYFFGTNNVNAGKVAGKSAADFIKKTWDGKLDSVLISYTENAGPEVKKRCSGIIDGLREAGIDIPDKNVTWVDPQSSDGTIAAKQFGTDYLTAHPDSHKILFAAVNDQSGLGFLSAVETANRGKDVAIVTHGADDPGILNLKKDNQWLGSVGYFPEKYGDYVMKLILDLNKGTKIAQETYMENVFIDRSNVKQIYPDLVK
jgi:ribose transport system substrate-binding protein